jgi:hypothetical protein
VIIMGLDNLLAKMERRATDTPDTPCNLGDISDKHAPIKACTPDTPDTPQIFNVAGNALADLSAAANSATSCGWLLHFANSESLDVYFNPDAAHAEILERYPDALAAEPIPERTRRTPTEAEAAKLRMLVQVIGKAEKCTADEIEWAMAGALADPDGALAHYRTLAVEHRFTLPLDDDRRTCNQCTNLAKLRCLAAWRGEIVANRNYTPIRHIPRRCEGYMPKANDEDRRFGRERWPELIESPGAANPAP